MSEPSVTIIMPALNEEHDIQAAVRDTLSAFDRLKINGETLVVNDGSTDRTGELLEELAKSDPRVRTIRHDKPQGIGASFWDGVENARGEFVCMIPGDNENDSWEILRYYPMLEHVDMVIPFAFNKQVRSGFRNILSRAYRFIVNTTFQTSFSYTNGTILCRRSLLQTLPIHSTGFFYQTDILVRLSRQGYLFAEVPFRLKARAHGQSKAISFKSLRRVMAGYLQLFYDIYLSRKKRVRSVEFVSGSQTAKRYAESMQSGQQA